MNPTLKAWISKFIPLIKNRKHWKARLIKEEGFSLGHVEFERPEVYPNGNIQIVLENRDVELRREVNTTDVDLRYLYRSDGSKVLVEIKITKELILKKKNISNRIFSGQF